MWANALIAAIPANAPVLFCFYFYVRPFMIPRNAGVVLGYTTSILHTCKWDCGLLKDRYHTFRKNYNNSPKNLHFFIKYIRPCDMLSRFGLFTKYSLDSRQRHIVKRSSSSGAEQMGRMQNGKKGFYVRPPFMIQGKVAGSRL